MGRLPGAINPVTFTSNIMLCFSGLISETTNTNFQNSHRIFYDLLRILSYQDINRKFHLSPYFHEQYRLSNDLNK